MHEGLRDAYLSPDRVRGLTHELYRYPARFSPGFVRQAIEAFSVPDDLVLDPFVGGGTSAVEALVAGRRFAGIDLNPLSVLLTRTKTTPIYRKDRDALAAWLERAFETEPEGDLQLDDKRLRNAPEHVVRTLAVATQRAGQLSSDRQRNAARAVLLHLGQWAVDGRQRPASSEAIRLEAAGSLQSFLTGIDRFTDEYRAAGLKPSSVHVRQILREGRAANEAGGRPLARLRGRVQLVVTSPPYPGVHVLYHRWQVAGRSETALPYWLADRLDGAGPKHYTMGGRSKIGIESYFEQMGRTWRAIRGLTATKAVVVQLVAFSDVDTQLPRYMDTMAGAGFTPTAELDLDSWRVVPSRKWYFRTQPDRRPAQEILLVHRAA